MRQRKGWLPEPLGSLRNWFRKDRADRELDAELRAYADLVADEKRAAGLPEPEARRQALAELGGIEPVKEAVREVRAGASAESLWRDVQMGARLLRRSPGFTLTAVLSLGLGIGFNASLFAVLDALLLRPLPVHEPERLVDIYTSGVDGDTYSSSSVPDLLDYRAQTRVFDDLIGYSPMFAAIGRGDRARLVLGEIVTGNYFQSLGVSPRLGRTLLPEDDRVAAPRVIVLSEQYWRREFGSDPQVLGRTLRVRGEPHAIVGVIGQPYVGMIPLLAPEVWVPTVSVGDIDPAGMNETVPSPTGTSRLDRRGQRWLFIKGRLKPGISVDQAAANVEIVAAGLRATHPQTNKDRRVTVRAAAGTRIHPKADGIVAWVVSGTMMAVGLVLVIACANVAGMLLARGSARAREVSIRLALGATRTRLVQQMLVESLLLAGASAAAGLTLAWWLTGLLGTVAIGPVPFSLALRLDAHVLMFTMAVAVATAMLAGLMPALKATRLDLLPTLRGDRPLGRAGRRWTLRDALVVGQMAVTMVLLVTAGLLLRSLTAAGRADVGFSPAGIAILSLDTSMLRYSDARSRRFFDEAVARLRALPGVDRVALASRLPFSLNFSRSNVAVPGHQKSADEMGQAVHSAVVSSSYFETLGIPLLQGRIFADTDTSDTPPVALVNQTMARQYWRDGSAIGQRVFERTLGSGRSFEIVGVVADHTLQTVGEAPKPAIFFPSLQRPSSFNVIAARTRGDDAALLAAMRQAILAIEPNVVFMESQTMRQQMSAMLLPVRAGAALVSVFGGFGLLLAAVGLYGVIAFSVARRTREIGIRLAIGARPRAVLGGIMRQGMTLAVAGLAAGALGAALAAKVVAGVLYGIGAADPVAWSLAAAVLLAVAALANIVPAWRAMRVEPSQALRVE